jgi:hypothetical protein
MTSRGLASDEAVILVSAQFRNLPVRDCKNLRSTSVNGRIWQLDNEKLNKAKTRKEISL